MTKRSALAALTIIALAGGMSVGCTSLHPAAELEAQPAAAAAPARAAGAGREETPPAGGDLPFQGPASWWLGELVFAPQPPPDAIVGIAVPAIVREPVANYVTPPDSRIPDGLAPTEMPTPKRPGQRAMGWVEPGPGAAAPDATGSAGAGEASGAEEPSNAGTTKGGPPPTVTPSFLTTFPSITFDDNLVNTGGGLFIPADPIGAVGPDHVVSVTNVSIQFHTKDGTPLLDFFPGLPITGTSLFSFFFALSPSPVNFTFDPKVIYDQHADRFVVITLERQDTGLTPPDPVDASRILVAVSDDSDPTGTWYLTSITATTTFFNSTLGASVPHWADYPGLAVDEEAVYITSNMFSFLGTGGEFGGTRLWVIDKFTGAGGGLYGGGTATVSRFDPYGASADCQSAATPPFCGTTQPAHVFGLPSAATPNIGTWLSFFSGLTAFGAEFMQVMRFDDPVGPGTPTFLGPAFVSMGNIDDLGGALPDAPQMGTAETIETNDRRTLDSVWRDDSLYVTTTVDPETGDPNAGEATAHWVHMGTSVLTGSPPPVALIDQGDVGGEDIAAGTHTFFPSIAVNSAGDVAVGFSASAATTYPSSAYATRAAADSAGTTRGSVVLGAGTDYYIRTFDSACAGPVAENRWGDYSGAMLDPIDECFWIYNQHAMARGTGTTGGCNGRPDPEMGRWETTFGRSCVCSESFSLTTGWWKQISMSCDQISGNRTLGDVFGDDLSGTYATDWIVKEVDPTSGINITKLLTDPLEIGKGYWIKTNEAAQTVENEGIDNVETETPLEAAATDGTGCGTSAGLCNMAGNPHKFDVCWADVEVIDGASTLSLATADPAGACQAANAVDNGCVMSRTAYKWNGAAWAPFDGATGGMEGTLVPWDGFYVSAAKSGIKLKVPATPGNCGAPERGGERGGGGWFIRLIVESGDLEDPANVMGQLPDSVDGYDSHDLPELPPLSPYLTVVFPHPEWGDRAGDYTSDYHLTRPESEPDAWSFEVRSSDPAATVTLRWQGPESRLLASVLTDLETSEQVAVAPDGSYTFTMNGTGRSFQWSLTGSDSIFEDGFESGDTGAW